MIRTLFVIAVCLGGVVSCIASDWWGAKMAADEAARAADRRPTLYSTSPDGCDVYTFKTSGGDWAYFTKCQGSKTTTVNPEICRLSGKVTVCDPGPSIVTETE